MSSSLFEKNVSQYCKKYGKIIKNFTDTSNLLLEKTKDDCYTLKLKYLDRELYLHSKYSPIKEAERFVEKIKDFNIKTVFIIYGMGLGYHILELMKYLHEENSLIIIEPNEEVLSKAFSVFDWTKLLNRKKTHLFTGTDRQAINLLLGEFVDITNAENIQFLTFSQYDKIYPEFYKVVYEEIKNYVSLFKISKNTKTHFWNKYNENFFNNLTKMVHEHSINDLKGQFNNVPAFIVSAGPSLDKNIKALRQVQNRGLIFSGGRTLTALIHNNIRPHFVVSMDPGIAAYEVLQEHKKHDIPLITTVVSNDEVIQAHQGDQFYIANSEYTGLIHYFTKKEMDILPLGASVANASAAIALYLGCNPIIFVGQDLAYTDGKYHAQSCQIGQEETDEDDRFEVEGIYGGKVWTNSVWYTFLMWMEKFIYHSSGKLFIDATEGGAKIHGTEILTLKESIEKYCQKTFDVDEKLKEIISNHEKVYQNEKLKTLLNNLKNNLDKLDKISDKALKDLEEVYHCDIESITIEHTRPFRVFEEQINKMMKDNPGIKDILIRVFEEINSNNDFIEKVNETEKEKLEKIIKRNQEFYRQIKITVKSIEGFIENLIENQLESIKIFGARIHFKS
ncbi:MAG TPA: DUF115 domain-containing protein [Defluviitaleaceae bacterium]|nr:motility associated factor glycosyltransferase family protein [Candidatus Epulonipiscium sp.]HQD50401.1 DUF115 domain-containing protein [Defluviitaleaceae bacterium]